MKHKILIEEYRLQFKEIESLIWIDWFYYAKLSEAKSYLKEVKGKLFNGKKVEFRIVYNLVKVAG